MPVIYNARISAMLPEPGPSFVSSIILTISSYLCNRECFLHQEISSPPQSTRSTTSGAGPLCTTSQTTSSPWPDISSPSPSAPSRPASLTTWCSVQAGTKTTSPGATGERFRPLEAENAKGVADDLESSSSAVAAMEVAEYRDSCGSPPPGFVTSTPRLPDAAYRIASFSLWWCTLVADPGGTMITAGERGSTWSQSDMFDEVGNMKIGSSIDSCFAWAGTYQRHKAGQTCQQLRPGGALVMVPVSAVRMRGLA